MLQAILALYRNPSLPRGIRRAGGRRAAAKTVGRIETLERRDLFSATVYGDFNGDGTQDLALGLPLGNVGSITQAGVVRVIYGSRDKGLQPFGDQIFHQNTPGTKEDAEKDDYFGQALAVGDFNADGTDDLAVGVPGEDIRPQNNGGGCVENPATPYFDCSVGGSLPGGPAKGNEGAVHVFYGSREKGLQAFGDQIWHQDIEEIKDIAEDNDEFGSVLAAGDFNGDGTKDLAVGTPKEVVSGNATSVGEGIINVIYGSRTKGLQSFGDQIFHQGSDGLREKERIESGDSFGYAIVAADFNGDRFADLAIGVPGEDVGSISNAGAVQVLYGSLTNGLQSFGDQLWHQGSDGLREKESLEAEDFFGNVLAAGDFNNDGRADLAVGVPYEDIVPFQGSGVVVNAGLAHVIYGSQAKGLQSFGDQIWHQEKEGLREKERGERDDYFAYAMAARDFNGDGTADLAVGVPNEDIGAIVNAGVVQVVYGSQTNGLVTFGDQIWHQNMELVTGEEIKDEAEANDVFGHALAAGDFNGDGRGDLAVRIAAKDGLFNAIYGSQSKGLQSFGDQHFSLGTEGLKMVTDDRDTAPISPTTNRPTGTINTVVPTFEWSRVAGAVRYEVHVQDSRGTRVLHNPSVAATTAATQSWTPTSTLARGQTYYWWVRGITANGTVGAWSVTQTITIAAEAANTAPQAPTLSWQPVSNTNIRLNWTNVTGEDGYVVQYYNATTKQWVRLATLGANVSSFEVASAYGQYYHVGAFNGVGTTYSSYIYVAPQATTPPAPTNLAWTRGTGSNINLSWSNVAGETGYRVEYWNATNRTWVFLQDVRADVTQLAITSGYGYYYRVASTNATGKFSYSNFILAS